MMRGRNSVAVAVRRPNGEINVNHESLGSLSTTRAREIPLLREIVVLIETLVLGVRALLYSATVAVEEWKQLHPDSEPTAPLVFRQPQIKQAQALLESAKAVLATAELNLQRTSVKMPVDVRITSESADLGQFIAAGQSVGKAYGIDDVEIEVPLEDKDLAWFDIPDAANDRNEDNGSEVLVKGCAQFEANGSNTNNESHSRETSHAETTRKLLSHN